MEKLAETIVRLRRERGMTQEALAEVIGVSAQTISKWENCITCPDVAVLPVIADTFGVSIDALFGREQGCPDVSADTAVDRVVERVREVFAAYCHDPEGDRSFDGELAEYRRVMTADPEHRSVIENDRDVLYFREKRGVLALRKPEDGWNTLFAHEGAAKLLRVLADDDFRRAMQVILRRRLLTFTLPTLARLSGVRDESKLETLLEQARCFARRELMIDETPLTYYELTWGESQLYLIYAVLAFAQEYADYQAKHFCFVGNMNYFTP